MKTLRPLFCFVTAFFISGCATNLKSNLEPGMAFDNLGEVYVARFDPDQRNLNQVIANELTSMGYSATAGELNNMPSNTDTLVTYVDNWMWDMRNYMIKINIKFNKPKTRQPIVSGESYRTSLASKSPEFMIRETLKKILEKKSV